MDTADMTVDSQNRLICINAWLYTIHSPYSHY